MSAPNIPKFRFLLVYLVVAAIGCSDGVTDPEAENVIDSNSPKMAIIDYSSPFVDPDALRKYAAADLVILESSYLLSNDRHSGFVDEIHAINPRTKVLGYQLAQTCWYSWGEASQETANRYGYDWYVATRPYWATTTEGDTVTNWPGQAVLDISKPECRAAMIDVIAKYKRSGPNHLDGVMWDYFGSSLWIPPESAAQMEGEPDLDGDGIPHFDDPDEIAALKSAQEFLVNELREELGSDFVQIFNGNRALSDSLFAGLGDGMLYELFPLVGFAGSDKYRKALDIEKPNNLFTACNWPRSRNGGPWLILSNNWQIGFTDPQGDFIQYNLGNLNRAVALLTDATAAYHSDGQIVYGWPDVDLDLGPPLGPAEIDGETYFRRFSRGEISVVLESGAYPMPFDFSITQNGEVVQYLDHPNHFP